LPPALRDAVARLRRLHDLLLRRFGLLLSLFAVQRAAWRDKHDRKACITSRRSGKTNLCLIDCFWDMQFHPNSMYAYIALTRSDALRIIRNEVGRINQDHFGGRLDLAESAGEVRHPNGAILYILGADQQRWIDKFRGQKYRRVIIDEAKSYSIDLDDFIENVIDANLTDQDGTLWLIGTPGTVQKGYWWDVTRPDKENRKKGWNVYHWSLLDNPYVKSNHLRRLRRRLLADPHYDKRPGFLREFRGLWVVDTGDLVYDFTRGRNIIPSFEVKPSMNFLAGLDFGHGDATAYAVLAYTDTSPELTVVESFAQGTKRKDEATGEPLKPLLLPELAERLRGLRKRYPGIRIIGDPDAKTLIEELQVRFKIPIESAMKAKKHDAIRALNSDLTMGLLRAVEGQPYVDEALELKKQHKGHGEWKEHPGLPNDCCDAVLYAWRECRHWNYEEPELAPLPGTQEALDAEEASLEEYFLQQARERYEDGASEFF
jgi:hypothetical protein